MPSIIDATGLTVATHDEVLTNYETDFMSIYGSDINLDSDSPDGEWLNDLTQSVIDLEDLLVQINNMFDPDNAIGVILDQRVAINGIQRTGGTPTITNITVTVSQALTLLGLDQTTEPAFTVADGAGNQWQLQTTQSISGPGSYVYSFQAALPGATLTTINSISIPVTIVLGVTTVNNPTTYTTLGVNEESDAVLKLRRQQSFQLGSSGFYNGLYAALKNIVGVTSVFIYENDTDATDANGVPSHSIWVVIAGSANSASIAQAIYAKRSTGCGMVGSQSYSITQADGTMFPVYWDVVQSEALFIRMNLTPVDGVTPVKMSEILTGLPSIYVPGVSAEVNINQLATFVQDIDPNALVLTPGFSTSSSGPFTNTLTPSARNKQFVVTQANIYALPVQILPITITVPRTMTQTFTAAGGSQTGYVYSFSVNASGGTINSSSGLYTAGSTTGVDMILVTDSLGNTAIAKVNVT